MKIDRFYKQAWASEKLVARVYLIGEEVDYYNDLHTLDTPFRRNVLRIVFVIVPRVISWPFLRSLLNDMRIIKNNQITNSSKVNNKIEY